MLNDSLSNDDLFLDTALLYLMNNFGVHLQLLARTSICAHWRLFRDRRGGKYQS
jgi:hypothetical protein